MTVAEAMVRRLIKQLTKRFSIVMRSGALKGMRIVAVAGPKFLHDEYEPEFFRAFVAHLSEGIVVYDIGAHWGYYSLVASRAVGDTGRVVAFEPNPENMQVIRRNIEYNQIKNIDCLEIAIGDTCGKVLFDVGPDTGWGRISDKGKLEVECRTLDSLMDSLPAPQVVKIDVEGAEDATIRGGMNLIKQARPVLFIETHGDKRSQECYRLLSNLGYEMVDLGAFEGRRWSMYKP